MSPREYAQRTAAAAVALVTTLSLGVMASQVADAAGAEQVIDTVGAHWTIPISAEITFPQGQQVLASRAFNTPWQRRLQRETAWLISGSLVERHDHGRWKVLRA